MERSFKTHHCSGYIKQSPLDFYDLIIEGQINDTVKDNTIFYIAAAGPDRRATFTGSGLPFANQLQAFENTPNIGEVMLKDNRFVINLITPNSYMVGLGSVTVPPTLIISYFKNNGQKQTISVEVGESIAYRTMTYPLYPRPRRDASFYDTQFELIPKTQEQVLYDSQYPCNGVTHPNFWGKKPTNA